MIFLITTKCINNLKSKHLFDKESARVTNIHACIDGLNMGV